MNYSIIFTEISFYPEMSNKTLYTYVQIKRFGSHLSHHQCEMLEENLTQVTGYGTAHILQTIQV